MPETKHTHFAVVTAQSDQTLTTWTANLNFPPNCTRRQAFDEVMAAFVRTNPSMANHVILFFDLQRNEV